MGERTWRSTSALIFCLAMSIAVADQVTKLLAVSFLEEHRELAIIPNFFNLTLVYNYGVAFGMGSGLADGVRQIVLWSATVAALLAVLYFLVTDYRSDRVAQSAIGLVLGGAVGNIIDRIRLGRVVDFLDFYIGSYHWPAFNVADSAICIGVFILIFRHPRTSESPA